MVNRKLVVETVDSFVLENDVKMIKFHSNYSRQNKFLVNGEICFIGEIQELFKLKGVKSIEELNSCFYQLSSITKIKK